MNQLPYQLYKMTSQQQADLIIDHLEEALTFWQRLRGLLNHSKLPYNQGLWIKPCNNIHTFFMKFSIDCLFLDKKMVVKKISKNIKPFRVAGPVWTAYSVIELPTGKIEEFNIQPGDQLYVVN